MQNFSKDNIFLCIPSGHFSFNEHLRIGSDQQTRPGCYPAIAQTILQSKHLEAGVLFGYSFCVAGLKYTTADAGINRQVFGEYTGRCKCQAVGTLWAVDTNW